MSRKTYIDNRGYRRFKNSGILVHRWIVGKVFGRESLRGNVVHHIDGNKLNNSPDNLIPMSWSRHSRLHYRSRKREEVGLTDFVIGCMEFTIKLYVEGIKFTSRLLIKSTKFTAKLSIECMKFTIKVTASSMKFATRLIRKIL